MPLSIDNLSVSYKSDQAAIGVTEHYLSESIHLEFTDNLGSFLINLIGRSYVFEYFIQLRHMHCRYRKRM